MRTIIPVSADRQHIGEVRGWPPDVENQTMASLPHCGAVDCPRA
jgi:hypothetical protein